MDEFSNILGNLEQVFPWLLKINLGVKSGSWAMDN